MKLKKTMGVLLATVIALGVCGCGGVVPDNSDIGGNSVYNVPGANKTVISVQNMDGGIGTVWLENAAERFAEQKQNESYATGKKGVYIDVERGSGMNLSLMANQTYNIYFHERNSDINDLAQAGLLLDISDVVTDTSREGGSLESNIYSNKLASLKGNDGKYYGLPHYEFFGGLSYDRDAFDEYNAYFAAEDDAGKTLYKSSKYGSAYMISDSDGKKSAGPDGEFGTEDDGLPRSMEELIILMDYFKQETDCAPVVLSGSYPNYSNYFFDGLWASLAGYQQMVNYYNCEGEIEIVTGYTDEPLFPGISYIKKPIVSKVTLTQETGYLGQQMAAKYYAIAMLEIIEREGFYSKDTYNGNVTHYDAQKCLIYEGQGKYARVAMLMEASYWYNEAKEGGSFKTYETLSTREGDRDLRFMALPVSFDNASYTPRESTLLDIGIGVCVVNGNIAANAELVKACKEFIAFLYTNTELAEFTSYTGGITRPIKYTLNAEQENALSNFGHHLYELRNAEGGNVVYYSGSTTAFKKAKARIKIALELPVSPTIPKDNIQYYTPLKQTDKDDTGVYKYGTKALFENTQLGADEWSRILNG